MPKTGHAKRFTEAQVSAALKATGGIYAHAAKWLTENTGRPCHRRTVNIYVSENPALKKLVDDLFEVHLDHAEALLFKNIEHGKEKSLHFFLATKGKARGYTRSAELTGEGGKALIPQAVDLSKLSTDQLRQIEELLAVAAVDE
jgi:hypothetical protein